mmetsp:Transcript_18481/g.57356  ORF Transcript_18481/g.57356 Transcript_18481/m.57356 type:complete len:323 (-) Transcript_18481:1031-1999(-)
MSASSTSRGTSAPKAASEAWRRALTRAVSPARPAAPMAAQKSCADRPDTPASASANRVATSAISSMSSASPIWEMALMAPLKADALTATPSSAIMRSVCHVPMGSPPCALRISAYVVARRGTSCSRMRSSSAKAASRRGTVSCTGVWLLPPLPPLLPPSPLLSGRASERMACSYTSQRSVGEKCSLSISSSICPAAASAMAPPPRQAPSAFTSVCPSTCRVLPADKLHSTISVARFAAVAASPQAEHAAMAAFQRPRSGARGTPAPPASTSRARRRTSSAPQRQSPAWPLPHTASMSKLWSAAASCPDDSSCSASRATSLPP